MPRETYQRLLLEELHATERWENRSTNGWDVSRLDAREMVLTLEESIRRGRIEDPGTRQPLEVLRGLGLLVEGDRLSRAAVVLFCKDETPQPDFPQLLLKVARFKGADRDEFLDNRQFCGNAFTLMRKAERFLLDSLPVAGRIVPGKIEREDTPLLPVEAWREALANAFVHRDYGIGGGSVSVALYDDRLEVISVGDLHFGLTPEALFREHESLPWNPMIAHVFYRRGIIEAWGRGTLKIARLMHEAGHEPPTVTIRAGAVVVTFGGLAAQAPSRHQVGTKLALSRHQVQILELAEQPKSFQELITPSGRTDRTKFRDEIVAPLLEAGLLELTVPDKPRSPLQQYRITVGGRAMLEQVRRES